MSFAYLHHIFQYSVLQEKLSLIESNQQIYQAVNLEKQRHCGTLQINFLISGNYFSNVIKSKLFIQCNTESFCEHITGSINIYLHACVSPLVPVCAMCLCLSMCDIKSEF